MVITCDVTAYTAAGDTTETSIGTINMPGDARRVLYVGVSQGGAGLTTAQGTAGMFRVSNNAIDLTPAKFPIDGGNQLTTGVYQQNFRLWPVNWTSKALPNSVFTIYVTMDMAITAANGFRGFIVYERG